MDLGDILDEIKAESPRPSGSATYLVPENYLGLPGDSDLMAQPMPSKDDMSTVIITLTAYEAWWLEWRLRVHLRSYRAMEWRKLNDVLTQIINKFKR
jgi:hypothetical protein